MDEWWYDDRLHVKAFVHKSGCQYCCKEGTCAGSGEACEDYCYHKDLGWEVPSKECPTKCCDSDTGDCSDTDEDCQHFFETVGGIIVIIILALVVLGACCTPCLEVLAARQSRRDNRRNAPRRTAEEEQDLRHEVLRAVYFASPQNMALGNKAEQNKPDTEDLDTMSETRSVEVDTRSEQSLDDVIYGRSGSNEDARRMARRKSSSRSCLPCRPSSKYLFF